MAFSHTIGGTTFTEASFEGNAYSDETTGFPKALEKMVEHVANAYRGTSTTSNVVGTGSKTWTVTNANTQIPAFAVGMPVRVARTSAPTTTYMQGEITAFTAATGSTTVNVSSSLGTGTHTDWTIVIGGHQTTASASPLGVANGGTGTGTHTANNVLVGAGTGAVASVAPSTSGNVLTSNGSAWTSAASVPNLGATSGVIETDGTYVAVCKFGPALDGVNWDEKTSAPTAKVMLATIKDAGADTTVQIWSGTVTPIAGSAALASVTLTGAATPTSIAGAGGILIIGCEDGVRFVGIVNNAWAELTVGWPRALSTTTTPALNNNDVQAVAAGIINGGAAFALLYGTGTDAATVIYPDGTLIDDVGTAVGDKGVGFFQGNLVWSDTNARVAISGPLERTTDFTSYAHNLVQNSANPYGFNADNGLSAHDHNVAIASDSGFTYVRADRNERGNGDHGVFTSAVTRAYNSGTLPWDIRGAWLANSVTADRSYKANTLTQNGTVTEAAVATGAELKGYGPFSTTNYLSRASDADWDVLGTGNIHMSGWFKSSAAVANETMMSFSNAGGTIRCSMTFAGAAGNIGWEIQGSTATGTQNSATTGLDDGVWHKCDLVQISSTERYIYVDGVLTVAAEGSTTTDIGSLSSTGNLPFAIGRLGGSSGQGGTSVQLALAHLSATAPTATQIRQMYDAEKGMFVASAKCLLQSATTDAVLDVDIDAITGFVTVVQTDDETVWKGLAIHSEPTIPTGGTTWEHSVRHAGAAFTITDANFAGDVPAISLRGVASDVQGLMGKLPAGVDLSKAKAWLQWDTGYSGNPIGSSFGIKSVTFNSTGVYYIDLAYPLKALSSNGGAMVTISVANGGAASGLGATGILDDNASTRERLIIRTSDDTGTAANVNGLMVAVFGELENE